MSRRIRLTKVKLSAFLAVLLVGATAIGVCAYFLAASSGSLTYHSTTPIATATAQTVTITLADASPVNQACGVNPDANWNFTDCRGFDFTISNPSPDQVTVNTVYLGSWSSSASGCNSTTLAGTFTAPAVTIDQSLAPGGSYTTTGYALAVTMNNLPSTDQSACEGATPTFVFDSN